MSFADQLLWRGRVSIALLVSGKCDDPAVHLFFQKLGCRLAEYVIRGEHDIFKTVSLCVQHAKRGDHNSFLSNPITTAFYEGFSTKMRGRGVSLHTAHGEPHQMLRMHPAEPVVCAFWDEPFCSGSNWSDRAWYRRSTVELQVSPDSQRPGAWTLTAHSPCKREVELAWCSHTGHSVQHKLADTTPENVIEDVVRIVELNCGDGLAGAGRTLQCC